MQRDLIIVGGGPAGAAAAIYAARKKLKTALIVEDWGGQSTVSPDIRNWIGTPAISGTDLANNFKNHVEANVDDSLEIMRTRATGLTAFDDHVTVMLKDGKTLEAKTVLITSGANRRTLDVPGAKEYEQKGLTYCASCDGPLFEGKDVAVIGGGNAGFETALQLLAYSRSVTLLNHGERFRADEITVRSAQSHPKMRAILNAGIVAVEGAQFATGLRWRDEKTGAESLLPVEGIFVEIGLVPDTKWTDDAIEKNNAGQIIVDARTQRTSHPRAWAAGDCTDGLYHQNNIAAGDAVKALEDIYMFVSKVEKEI